MATVTYDGQSFMLDGRRLWLVCGSISYARVPRRCWRDRIHAARLAGLNTIQTTIVWSRHEQIQGRFDFEGENDLRHFLELVSEAGLHCLLRVGPFVGDGLDMGGLPAWLGHVPQIQLRTKSGPFLEASGRFISAVAAQIKDLQVTSPGTGGPVLLVQVEDSWTCGDADLAAGYLRELARYLRESGVTVPTVNANNLWQGIEGQIDGWVGSDHLLATVRQLREVRPNQPRLIVRFRPGSIQTWGQADQTEPSPMSVQRRLAEILVGGGQFCIDPFHSGTMFEFAGGRRAGRTDAFLATSPAGSAPLGEAGGPGPSYHAVRRLCTFASSFGRLFAGLDPDYRPITLDPAWRGAGTSRSPARWVSVSHATGTQGGVAFLFRADPGSGPVPRSGGTIPVLLPNGSSLDVDMGNQAVAWCVFDYHLFGRARLDYCGLNAFATVGTVFVCYGPASGHGELSINGSPLTVKVPSGKNPIVIEHEGVTVVVCSEDLIDATFIGKRGVCVGAAWINASGNPHARSGQRRVSLIARDGRVSKVTPTPASTTSGPVALSPWQAASTEEYARGASPRFAGIEGPADLASLGTATGYGWYRLDLKSFSARRTHVSFVEAGDRHHIYQDGEFKGLVGRGPGAALDLSLSLKKGKHTIVLLSDNMGRASGGSCLNAPKGLFGHVWETQPIKAGRCQVRQGAPVDLLGFRSPLWDVRRGDVTAPDRVTWSFIYRKKTPVIVSFQDLPDRGVLLVNDEPFAWLDEAGPREILLPIEALSRGTNVIQVALVSDGAGPEVDQERAREASKVLSARVSFLAGARSLTEKAKWAFARWEPPAAGAFVPVAKSSLGGFQGPTWWRSRFEAKPGEAPLFLDAAGLTKGQVFINGRNLCRYFVATREGEPVPPQTRYFVPDSWLKPDGDNDLMIFDEHGGNPGRCRLVRDGDAEAIRA